MHRKMIFSVSDTVGIIMTVCSNGDTSVLLEKYTIHKIQAKLYKGPRGIFFISWFFTSEDIDDIISCFFTVVCESSQFV